MSDLSSFLQWPVLTTIHKLTYSFLAGRGIVLSAPKEYKLPYKSFDKLNTYEGIKLSLGDRSGCSVECFVENGTKRSDLMSLNVGDEFIFFGGAKTILRGNILFECLRLCRWFGLRDEFL